MSDLIDRQEAIDALGEMPMSWADTDAEIQAQEDWKQHREALLKLPTAEPRKGRWVEKPNVFGVAYCSVCDYELHTNDTNFCPNCGARMEESDEHTD